MPTTRRRRFPQRQPDHTASPRMLAKLLSCHDWRFLDPDLGEELPHGMLVEAWEFVGEELTEWWAFGPPSDVVVFWTKRLPRPGSRPWGWWAFAAPEPLGLRPGVTQRPASDQPGNAGHWFSAPNGTSNMFETERDYLTRLNLWLPGERRTIEC